MKLSKQYISLIMFVYVSTNFVYANDQTYVLGIGTGGASLTGDYLTLVNDYIQPMLIHYAMIDYLPFAAYELKNGGLLGNHISLLVSKSIPLRMSWEILLSKSNK